MLKQHLALLKKESAFAKNVTKVLSGSLGAQIVAIAISPVLTRLYGPEAFGVLAVFMAVAAIATPMASLRYDMAIVLPKSESEALTIFRIGVRASVAVGIGLLLLLVLFNKPLVRLVHAEEIESYLSLVALLVLVSGVLGCVNFWLIRKKRFGALSLTMFGSAVGANGFKVVAGFAGAGTIGLIIGTLMQQVINLVGAIFIAKKTFVKQKTDVRHELRVARQYIDFPLFRMPQNVLNAVTVSMPQLMMAVYFSFHSVGIYMLAVRIVNAPVQIMRKAFSDVFYQRISEVQNQGKSVYEDVMKATTVIILLGVLPVVLLFVFGEEIFSLLFGDEWGRSGVYAAWVSLWKLSSFANVPAVCAVPVLGWNKYFLWYEVFAVIVSLIVFIVAAENMSVFGVVIVVCLVGFLRNLVLIASVLFSIRHGSSVN